MHLKPLLPLLVCGLAAPSPFRHPDSREVRQAVQRGLSWLVAHQSKDGRWDCDAHMRADEPRGIRSGAGNPVYDVGVTSLALLALLIDGSTASAGPHRDSLRRGLDWLVSQQDRQTGLVGSDQHHDFIYGHAIAAWVLCEAAARGNSKARQRYRKAARQAVNFLLFFRNPKSGWRYRDKAERPDLSVSSWATRALVAAKQAGLLHKVPRPQLLAFVDELSELDTGRHGYTRRGETSARRPGDHAQRFPIQAGTMTAVGLCMRLALGQTAEDAPILPRAVAVVLAELPDLDQPENLDMYFWMHATLALKQLGGAPWRQWTKACKPVFLRLQRNEKPQRGSWDPIGVWGEDGGRVYATAMMTICLRLILADSPLLR